MIGGVFFLLLRQHHRPTLGPHHHLVLGRFEIGHGDKAAAKAGGDQRSLVHKVGKIRTREPRRAARNHPQVNVRPRRHFAGMDRQNLLTALDVRVRHMDLAVKTARTQQCRVQHVFAVGGGDDDHTVIRLKPVHLNQKLVQRLLALVIAAAHANATRPAHSVNLVDEHDARRVFLGLLEHVAHAACADADEHFDKVRARDGKERNPRLTRNGARQERLTRTGRANQQSAFRNLATKTREFLRIAQEFHNLLKLFLGLINPGHIVKGHAAILFGQELGLGFAKAHRPAFAAALHPVHEENPDADQHDKGQPQRQQAHKARRLLRFSPHLDALVDQPFGQLGVIRGHGGKAVAGGVGRNHTLAVNGGAGHLTRIHPLDEF